MIITIVIIIRGHLETIIIDKIIMGEILAEAGMIIIIKTNVILIINLGTIMMVMTTKTGKIITNKGNIITTTIIIEGGLIGTKKITIGVILTESRIVNQLEKGVITGGKLDLRKKTLEIMRVI